MVPVVIKVGRPKKKRRRYWQAARPRMHFDR